MLHPPAVDPGITDEERRVLDDLIAKGTVFGVNLASADLDAAFERIAASGADVPCRARKSRNSSIRAELRTLSCTPSTRITPSMTRRITAPKP